MHLIAFDVETYGKLGEYALQPFRATTGDAWLTSYATAEYVDGEIVTQGKLMPTVSDMRKFLKHAHDKDAYVVAWNAPFDVAWLIALGLREEVYKTKWLDGLLLWRHLVVAPQGMTQPTGYGLKNAVRTYAPVSAGYEEGVEFGEVSEKLLAYNKEDALHTLWLAKKFLAELDESSTDTRSRRTAALLEAKCIPMVAESMVNGLHIDGPALDALDAKLEAEGNSAFVKLKLNSPDITAAVLNSPKQLANLLHKTWNLPVFKVTDKGAESTDKEALHQLANCDERAAWVRDYREAVGNRAKFVTSTKASIDYNGDGCTRPAAKIYGTYTGRMTYFSKQGTGKGERPTGVALHQWKRDKAFRATIIPPPGYTLLEFDFAGQEFRWMAVEANDPTMLELCQPGADAHAYMGARIANVDYAELRKLVQAGDPAAKSRRQLGKVANLSLQYRTSAKTLQKVAGVQYGLDLTPASSKAIHGTYITTYRAVPKYWDRQIYMAKKYRWVQTIAGRRLQLPWDGMPMDGYGNLPWSVESSAINFPIQGVGADQKYLALAVLRNYLPQVGGRFYFELHDGMFVIVPDDKAETAVHNIKYMLSNLPYKRAWGVTLPIQFPVDAKMGKSWGALKDVE